MSAASPKAKILAVDFDGTLVEHDYPRVGPDVPGAVGWMKYFDKAGVSIILWTMRSDVRPAEVSGDYPADGSI